MNAPGLSSGDDAARLREGAGFTRRFTPSGEEETASRSSRSWEVGKLGSWEVGKLGSWEVGKLGSWEVGKLGSWEVGKLGSWEVGKLGSWEVGKLGSWEVGKFPIHYSTGGRGAQRRGRFAGADGEIAGFPARRRRFTHEKYRLLTAESGRASGGADATSCGRLSKSAADGNPLPEKRPGRGGARAAPRGFAPFGEARGFQVSQGRSLPGAAPRFGNRPAFKRHSRRRRRVVPERPLRDGRALVGREYARRTTTGGCPYEFNPCRRRARNGAHICAPYGVGRRSISYVGDAYMRPAPFPLTGRGRFPTPTATPRAA